MLPVKYCQSADIRKLPGGLNDVPCFNSNSPELVLSEGILLSTFPALGMKHPQAHLNYAFDGRFDLFSHHVARNESSEEDRTLFLGFLASNPNNRKVRIQVLSGASYLSQPDAPFKTVPELCLDNEGKIFTGPGDRVAQDIIRGRKPGFLPGNIWLAPGETKLLFCLPVPVRHLIPALNGRSTLLKLYSSGPVYIASLARFFGPASAGNHLNEKDWLVALENYDLAKPRDEMPSPPGFAGHVKYGRVSGVSRGTEWTATITDRSCAEAGMAGPAAVPAIGAATGATTGATTGSESYSASFLSIPAPGKSLSFPLSTVGGGTFGTGQVQSAAMIVRYQDTAYEAHGNYGVRYRISMPLHNPYSQSLNLELLFQSAIKSDEPVQQLCFYDWAAARAFFRGSVFVSDGSSSNFWHLVLKQGAEGAKLAEFSMPAGARRELKFEFIYPPDATPPQELSIRTVKKSDD